MSDKWTGFTRFPMLNEKTPDGWSGRRLTRKQTTSMPDTLWLDRDLEGCPIEEPKLDNARRLRGVHFIDPEDGEFKEIMKNSCRKLEIPMPAAMLCKISTDRYREICRTVAEHCRGR